MSNQEILDYPNNCIQAKLNAIKNYQHIAIQIPPGQSQIEYCRPGGYWVARGDVLRCETQDGGQMDETTIWVDDEEFTMEAFGQLLSPFIG